jgi:hypothetical protein
VEKVSISVTQCHTLNLSSLSHNFPIFTITHGNWVLKRSTRNFNNKNNKKCSKIFIKITLFLLFIVLSTPAHKLKEKKGFTMEAGKQTTTKVHKIVYNLTFACTSKNKHYISSNNTFHNKTNGQQTMVKILKS